MKKIFSIIIMLMIAKSFAFSQCNQSLIDNCVSGLKSNLTYLHQYKTKLGPAADKASPPVARFSVLLTKGNVYQFNVCSALDFEGEAILQLLDGTSPIANTYNPKTKTNYKAFKFQCNKSAIYNIYISFVEGKPGCAVGLVSMVDKK
jgi:hypothetical protein